MSAPQPRRIDVLDTLDVRPVALETLDGFVPPPRFGTTSFADYEPAHPSQEEARTIVADFAAQVGARQRPRRIRLPWSRPEPGSGLYLDGGFGVGKTHLLAAAWHAAPLPSRQKRYLSFQELVYVIGVLGRDGSREAFSDVALLCIDEFELDDPGNTLIIANFLREAFAAGTSVLTTSNTPPAAQGSGRFAVEDFRREIQGIADRFTPVPIDGPDHRAGVEQASWSSEDELAAVADAAEGSLRIVDGPTLTDALERHHPVRYRGLLRHLDLLIVRDLAPFDDQNGALRFVHFVDKLYDLGVGLRASGRAPLEDTFHPGYRHGAYAKKHNRCLSRLSELLTEPVSGSGETGVAPQDASASA